MTRARPRLLLAAILAAACSGDDGDASAGTAASTDPSATAGATTTESTTGESTAGASATDPTTTGAATTTTTATDTAATSDTADTADTGTTGDPKPAIYVGLDGDDANPGTYDAPLRTFPAALAAWQPGYEIRVFGGTWHERLDIPDQGDPQAPIIILPVDGEAVTLDGSELVGGQPLRINGSHVRVAGLEVRGSTNQCVSVGGSDVTLEDLEVHECVSHGVELGGQGLVARRLRVHRSVLENEGEQGAWGSALKIKIGGAGILVERNHVWGNWGEGIAVTRGVDVVVRDNWSHDNYGVNIYIDNSHGVLVERNFATATGEGPLKAGDRPVGIMLGEEYYDGWGAQLADVTIQNNIIAFCGHGIGWWGAEIDGGGLDNVAILHNTIWGTLDTALSIAYDPEKTVGSVIANNLVQQPDDAVAWIEDRTGLDMHHNFWVGPPPEAWRNCDGDGDRSGDPALPAAPALTVATYRLGPASPARDAAAVLAEVAGDFEGRARVSARSPGADIGAMEYGDPAEPAEFDGWWD